MSKALEKSSLLAVSLLVNSAGAILPSLPLLTAEFSGENKTLVELVSTLPSLFVMLTVPFSPSIAKKIGYKRTVQLGLILCLLGGLLPIVTRTFPILFLSRIIFGIGLGLFNPLLFSFSANRYHGKELSDMIGFQSAFEGMGGILVSFVVAQLIMNGWRSTLWVYLIILPIGLVFSLFVPEIETFKDKAARSAVKVKLDSYFWGYVLLLMVLITVYTSVSVKLTALLLEAGYGNAKDASNGLAIMGVGAMSAGFLFGKARLFFKEWLLPVSFALLGLSLLGLALTDQIWVMLVCIFLIGLAFRTFVPYLLDLANQVSDNSGERRTSLLLMAFNIGLAFAPVTLNFIQRIFHFNYISHIFIAESLMVFVIAIGASFYSFKSFRK
ncbi:MFS transporter [Streptococcus merionis]|uniref:MFS transporter n=1 Tax=Streptococcus merionis TaxID=400065 RepID=UPI0035177C0F